MALERNLFNTSPVNKTKKQVLQPQNLSLDPQHRNQIAIEQTLFNRMANKIDELEKKVERLENPNIEEVKDKAQAIKLLNELNYLQQKMRLTKNQQDFKSIMNRSMQIEKQIRKLNYDVFFERRKLDNFFKYYLFFNGKEISLNDTPQKEIPSNIDSEEIFQGIQLEESDWIDDENEDTIVKFEVGKIYYTRFISDSESFVYCKIIARTDKQIKIQILNYKLEETNEIKKVGVSTYESSETAYPLGKYSMAPVIRANRELTKEMKSDIEKKYNQPKRPALVLEQEIDNPEPAFFSDSERDMKFVNKSHMPTYKQTPGDTLSNAVFISNVKNELIRNGLSDKAKEFISSAYKVESNSQLTVLVKQYVRLIHLVK